MKRFADCVGIFFFFLQVQNKLGSLFFFLLVFFFLFFPLLFAKLNLGSGVLIVTSDWNSRWCAQDWKQLSVHQFHGPTYLLWPRPGLHPHCGINAEQIETYPLYN